MKTTKHTTHQNIPGSYGQDGAEPLAISFDTLPDDIICRVFDTLTASPIPCGIGGRALWEGKRGFQFALTSRRMLRLFATRCLQTLVFDKHDCPRRLRRYIHPYHLCALLRLAKGSLRSLLFRLICDGAYFALISDALQRHNLCLHELYLGFSLTDAEWDTNRTATRKLCFIRKFNDLLDRLSDSLTSLTLESFHCDTGFEQCLASAVCSGGRHWTNLKHFSFLSGQHFRCDYIRSLVQTLGSNLRHLDISKAGYRRYVYNRAERPPIDLFEPFTCNNHSFASGILPVSIFNACPRLSHLRLGPVCDHIPATVALARTSFPAPPPPQILPAPDPAPSPLPAPPAQPVLFLGGLRELVLFETGLSKAHAVALTTALAAQARPLSIAVHGCSFLRAGDAGGDDMLVAPWFDVCRTFGSSLTKLLGLVLKCFGTDAIENEWGATGFAELATVCPRLDAVGIVYEPADLWEAGVWEGLSALCGTGRGERGTNMRCLDLCYCRFVTMRDLQNLLVGRLGGLEVLRLSSTGANFVRDARRFRRVIAEVGPTLREFSLTRTGSLQTRVTHETEACVVLILVELATHCQILESLVVGFGSAVGVYPDDFLGVDMVSGWDGRLLGWDMSSSHFLRDTQTTLEILESRNKNLSMTEWKLELEDCLS